ncbi:MAG: hypothetical protein ACOY3J_02725 [Bacillota bacterium]|uniref:Uncharacterized protein n=1 Tax=Thermanaerosceptrum fracticalcis TaxID=1712410 RepID=A0A7G6E5E6_THEFR|nr:hypothetical protein [Thermanaerosceptrum fracticalcis]QNB47300.1 hypothetical protein BR63_13980 [Thermanaerosceptrum fracticalcis]
MRLMKGAIIILLVFVTLSIAYLGIAVAASSWYPELNMETQFKFSNIQKRINDLQAKFKANPLEPVNITLTDNECEGIFKNLIKNDTKFQYMIKGVGLKITNGLLDVKTNIELYTYKIGLSAVLKPYYQEGTQNFVLRLDQFKIGPMPLPPRLVLYFVNKINPGQILVIHKDTMTLNLKGLPFDLAYLKLDNHTLQAAFALSTAKVTKMVTKETVLLQEVTQSLKTVEKNLNSPQAKDFISSLKNKASLAPADVEKAKQIYDQLSSKDKELLKQNLEGLLNKPEVQEALAKYGYKL